MTTPSKPANYQYVWHNRDPAQAKDNRSQQVKVFDGQAVGQAVDTWGGGIYPLCEVAQGSTIAQRVGLRIRPVDFVLRFQTSADGDAMIATSQEIRILIFQDLQQASDTKTAVDDVLESLNDRCVTLTPAFDKDVPGKVRVYHDRVYSWGFNTTSTQLDELHIDGKNLLPIIYNGANGTDIQKNGLYLLVVSSCVTSPTPATYWPPGLNLSWRLTFHNA